MTVSKRELAELWKRESNLKMKERLLLTLRVEVDGGGEVPAHVVQELHRKYRNSIEVSLGAHIGLTDITKKKV